MIPGFLMDFREVPMVPEKIRYLKGTCLVFFWIFQGFVKATPRIYWGFSPSTTDPRHFFCEFGDVVFVPWKWLWLDTSTTLCLAMTSFLIGPTGRARDKWHHFTHVHIYGCTFSFISATSVPFSPVLPRIPYFSGHFSDGLLCGFPGGQQFPKVSSMIW